MINLLKSQKELVEDTTSKIIIFVGGYGSGRTFASAIKALSSKVSLVLDLNFDFVLNIQYPVFEQALDGVPHTKSLANRTMKTEDSLVFLNHYDRVEKMNMLQSLKTDVMCFNNFDLIEEYLAIKFLKIAQTRTKQVVLFVHTKEAKPGSFIRELAKTEKVIHASLLDNPHLTEDYIRQIKTCFKSENEYKNELEGKFT